MSDSVFLDSNIIIYSYSNSEPDKQAAARTIIKENNSVVSTQVLQEITNIITRKFKYSYSDTKAVIDECCNNNSLHINTENTILLACDIASKYNFSFYDSLIIAAAIESKCTILYSEDMQHNQYINNIITIINPFL